MNEIRRMSSWPGRLARVPTTMAIAMAGLGGAQAADNKPNILVIMGDDIGMWNITAYSHGMMGYSTPNIDRIAREGAIFSDLYAQQSCTAGRAAFITGQSPFRTGLLKVGLPGAKEGLSDKDPTLAGYHYSWGDLLLAYRNLYYSMNGDNLIKDVRLTGPALGVSFRW